MPGNSASIIFTLLGICLISFSKPCDGGNILVFPVDGSHWVNMKILLEELHARGHSITVIRSSHSWYIAENSSLYSSITIQMKEVLWDFFDVYLEEQIKAQIEGISTLNFLRMTRSFLTMICEAHTMWADALIQLLDDADTVQKLKDARYDVVLTDPAIASGVLLAKYLNLPLVLNVRWIPSGDGHSAIAPSPLSYIPVPGSGLTDKMNFYQRVKNMAFYGIAKLQQRFVESSYNDLCDKFITGQCDITALIQEADIWLFRSDFVFDFPRPTMPNVIYIGGFQCKPPQPLPADLEAFVESAGQHGVIVMTLGTLVNALPIEVADEIAAVFAKMPQKVIWRHKGKRPSTLGNNTLIVDWMPQKDLLGHPQTKVFVAHGGTNGVQEAIYHGVPVLGIPLFFDQYDNLLRLQERGAGRILQLHSFNGHSFQEALNEVLHQDGYRRNMQTLSSLHRDQPMAPMDLAVFWLEYVMRNKGAPHLRTDAYKMPWYSYNSLDVMLLLLTCLTALLLSPFFIFRLLCKRKRKTKTKQQ